MGVTTRLLVSIKRHEGFRSVAYRDSVGVWTIGYGTNLEVMRVSEQTAAGWLQLEVDRLRDALFLVAGFETAGNVRRDVLTEMAYQLGLAGVRKFKRMWAAVERKDWTVAAAEMMDSRWAREQTPRRAAELAMRMRTGRWEES